MQIIWPWILFVFFPIHAGESFSNIPDLHRPVNFSFIYLFFLKNNFIETKIKLQEVKWIRNPSKPKRRAKNEGDKRKQINVTAFQYCSIDYTKP